MSVSCQRTPSGSSKFGQQSGPALIWSWAGQGSQQHPLRDMRSVSAEMQPQSNVYSNRRQLVCDLSSGRY